MQNIKIAMTGTKGIPAKWGGIEKYVEEVGRRLVQNGHEVTVFTSSWYCRDYRENYYKGMKIIRIPSLHTQATDAISNSLFSCLLIIFGHYDVIHLHGYASYFFIPLLRLAGKPTLVTSHGLVDSQWNNPKYGSFANKVIRFAGRIGIKNASCVTTVADYWKKRIKEEYDVDSIVLASGIDDIVFQEPDIIKAKYGLDENSFLLFLGRIDPIKKIDWLLKAMLPDEDLKIVVAGGAQDSITDKHFKELKEMRSGNSSVIFTGPVSGKEKMELLSNCKLFINPSGSEGLPITVLEAMSYGRCCLVSDIPAHKEIIEDRETGYLFRSDSFNNFQEVLSYILKASAAEINAVGVRGKKSIENLYNWNKTTELTEELYKEVADVS